MSPLLLDGGDEAIQLRLETGLATSQCRIEVGKLAVGVILAELALLRRGRSEEALLLFRT